MKTPQTSEKIITDFLRQKDLSARKFFPTKYLIPDISELDYPQKSQIHFLFKAGLHFSTPTFRKLSPPLLAALDLNYAGLHYHQSLAASSPDQPLSRWQQKQHQRYSRLNHQHPRWNVSSQRLILGDILASWAYEHLLALNLPPAKIFFLCQKITDLINEFLCLQLAWQKIQQPKNFNRPALTVEYLRAYTRYHFFAPLTLTLGNEQKIKFFRSFSSSLGLVSKMKQDRRLFRVRKNFALPENLYFLLSSARPSEKIAACRQPNPNRIKQVTAAPDLVEKILIQDLTQTTANARLTKKQKSILRQITKFVLNDKS